MQKVVTKSSKNTVSITHFQLKQSCQILRKWKWGDLQVRNGC